MHGISVLDIINCYIKLLLFPRSENNISVVVVIEVVVEGGEQRSLQHTRPQQQRALHELLPLHVRVVVIS